MIRELVDASHSAAGRRNRLSGLGVFTPVAGADRTLFDLFPRVQVLVEEPVMIRNQAARWWSKVEQRHDRSGIGSLVTLVGDLLLTRRAATPRLTPRPAWIWTQLGAVDVLEEETGALGEVSFSSRPTLRFHGSIPAFLEQIKTLAQQGTRMLMIAPNQGEVERMAGLLREYGQPYRLGSRVHHAGQRKYLR